MTFELPDKYENTADALRALEPQAPKALKAVLIQAADELDDWQRVATDVVRELGEAATLRIGMMDSLSRADEVARQIKTTLTTAASRLRALTQKGESHVRRT